MGHHHHHKNQNSNPSSHFKNPKDYPTSPAPQSSKGSSFLGRLKQRMNPDATMESNKQLRMNVEREELKTKGAMAKHNRPPRFGNLLSSGSAPGPARRGMSRQAPRQETNSFLFGSNNNQGGSGGWLNQPSSNDNFMGMLGAGGSPPQKGKKGYVKSGFDELFGI